MKHIFKSGRFKLIVGIIVLLLVGMLISAVHSEEGEEKLHLLMVDPHIPAGAKLY